MNGPRLVYDAGAPVLTVVANASEAPAAPSADVYSGPTKLYWAALSRLVETFGEHGPTALMADASKIVEVACGLLRTVATDDDIAVLLPGYSLPPPDKPGAA